MRAGLILLALTSVAWAQEPAPNMALDPPRSAGAETLRSTLQAEGIRTDLTYAASAEGIAKPPPPPPPEGVRQPLPIASWWILGGLVVALALWLRFGGAGMLARRAPSDPAAPTVPQSWEIEAPQAPASLLAQIEAMPDRSAALVRLLRHCLLQSARDSRTQLARSDTEREALARLPGERPALRLILRAAELAHYGGRPVSDADFHAALGAGRRIIEGAHV